MNVTGDNGFDNEATWLINVWISNDRKLWEGVRKLLTPNDSPVPRTRMVVNELGGGIEYIHFDTLLRATIRQILAPLYKYNRTMMEQVKGIPCDIYKAGRRALGENYNTGPCIEHTLRQVNWQQIVDYIQEDIARG